MVIMELEVMEENETLMAAILDVVVQVVLVGYLELRHKPVLM